MAFDFDRARQYLQSFNFRKLFIEEIGWDKPGDDLEIPYEGDLLYLEAVAQKRGLSVFLCSPQEDGNIPNYAGRRKIETELRKSVHEHILIFTNQDNSKQVWQWVRREPGRPTTSREYEYNHGQSGDPLLQRLQKLVITLEEEEKLGIVDVTSRVRAAFDVEPVTKRFYDRYSKEHAAFMQFLNGIPDEKEQRWYASVTLNRLMFVYFIQKKLFLNNDEDYLRGKLLESKRKGQDLYYHDFLCPLFFEGFAVNKAERKPEFTRLFGDVPYLNGGIFQKHQIENAHGTKIQIADAAFERVFDFFEQYRWHLDERPLRNDKEINPDVLGYIFEKYINQKDMGAYYTKEDITGYISRSTILPYLLDQTKKDCAIAFTGEHSVWNLLALDPNRYIFTSVQTGCGLPLPADIEAGINDVTKRDGWNKAASEKYALPTETWREVVARRTRYEDLYRKLVSTEVLEVNDLITHNLDIEQFTQDLVEGTEGPELLRAFWKALRSITILDPTCGSGAFLFAALNILEPLYEACLDRMRVFITELDQSGEKHRPEKFSDFRDVLNLVDQHQNERYFILKSIIVNNLYGVDIMEEAVEICKLRLFLKLIAQVDQAKDVEPLLDIDFNIRTGNTLVGFTAIDEVKKALMGGGLKTRLPYPEEEAQIKRIIEDAELYSNAYDLFRNQQLIIGNVTPQDKVSLQKRLDHLNDELDQALAKTYGVDTNTLDFTTWRENHKPFHWLVNYFGIMTQGGFDVLIGNPPYVEYNKIKYSYKVYDFVTENIENLYAAVLSRSTRLGGKNNHYAGFIVPISICASDRFLWLRQQIMQHYCQVWFSNYEIFPQKLFDGAFQRLTIFIGHKKNSFSKFFVTNNRRWFSAERPYLFATIQYNEHKMLIPDKITKLASTIQFDIFNKILMKSKGRIIAYELSTRRTDAYIFYQEAINNWMKASTILPFFKKNGKVTQPAHGRYLYFKTSSDTNQKILQIIHSSLFYIWFSMFSDGFHLNDWLVKEFPLDSSLLLKLSQKLFFDLENDIKKHSVSTTRNTKTDKIEIQSYRMSLSKPLIDEIDKLIAEHYGFTDAELDFIVNYDIKYRMGADAEEPD